MSRRCRVFVNPDQTVRVVHPFEGARKVVRIDRDGMPILESDAVFYRRVFAEAIELDPTLAGLPYHDIDPSDLPARTTHCDDPKCTGEHSTRDQWRGNPRSPLVTQIRPEGA